MRGAEPVTFRETGMDTLVRNQLHIADIPRRLLAISLLTGIVVVIGCAGGAQNSGSTPVIPVTPATYTIGGPISGLSGTGLVLKCMQNLQSVTWSSSNQAACTITNDASDHGAAFALAAGESTITASAGSISGSAVLTVQ